MIESTETTTSSRLNQVNYNDSNLKNIIKNEIKKEKKIPFFISLFSFLIILAISIIISIKFFFNKKLPENNFFLTFWILIPLLLFFIWIFVISCLSLYKIRQEEKIYYSNDENFNLTRIPIFIKNSFKRNLSFKIFINWFSISSYIYVSIVLTIMLILKNEIKIPFFNIGIINFELKFEHKETIDRDIFILISYLCTIFILHLLFFILLTKKINKLNISFDLEKNLNIDEIRRLKRNTNIVCAIIFLLPLFLIILFILIKNWKRKNKRLY